MKFAIISALLVLAPLSAKAADKAKTGDKAKTVELSVTDKGFEPETVTVKKGEPIHLMVTRKTDATCATEVVFKDLGIKKELPLNKAVAIDLPAQQKAGDIHYMCGMNMIGGVVRVE